MTDTYTFHLRNLQQHDKSMYLFLAPPMFAQDPENVYQNSSTFLSVPLYNPDKSQTFKATVQYLLQVAQQSEPVKIGNQVISTAQVNANLGKGYQVTYSSDQGGAPDIVQGTTQRPPAPDKTNMVAETNGFTPVQNYYNSLTFGVVTNTGMTGVTWEPDNSTDYTITPTLTFYIAVGSYKPSALAQIDATSVYTAVIESGYGGNFDQFGNTWVTYKLDGTWDVEATPWTN